MLRPQKVILFHMQEKQNMYKVGATHLRNYLSEQCERNKRIDTVHSAHKRYMGWGNLIRTGDFFEVEYCPYRGNSPRSGILVPN